ncbi:histidine phosphatase family protein [Corynebacterium uropygiale]|uniref:Histidine phosphatase family protein n=1 Tax=Corynebacterium uropygiale TaxID=1775911 RepID=A0A9X1QM90_9CORY|nr:histidine phosphatase family protein [Corynebacterium uropygiale]MCF4005829.1 histidine phosphatase family protein [Corynebacterium uropygiale]
MSTTLVHLVRHGEVFNPDRILYGRLPGYHLSSRGQSQAARTAESFRGHDVTYLTASPLERTQETATPICTVTGLGLTLDGGVIEAGNAYQGLRVRGWRSQLWHPRHWRLMTNPTIPSWGEPYTDIAHRMMDAIERARVAAEGHEAIIVSHQLPIVCVQRTVRGQRLAHNPTARECDLASVTSLLFKGTEIVDLMYSEPAQEI